MGPYSTALAYISEEFNDGIPVEESWMTRTKATRFDRLTNYVDEYKPGANIRISINVFNTEEDIRELIAVLK